MASVVDRAESVLTPCDRQEVAGTGESIDTESRVIQHVPVALPKEIEVVRESQ